MANATDRGSGEASGKHQGVYRPDENRDASDKLENVSLEDRGAVMEVLDEEAVDRNGRPLPPVVKSAPGLEDRTIAELKEEIARRNEGRDEADQISASGNKSDLIAAIAADDNREGVQ